MSSNFPKSTQKVTTSDQERARLRRNQRNSRARRQAHVEDLERRWADCVAQGAQASSELQHEARRVLSENKILRLMLLELGVDHAAIQHRLKPASALNESASETVHHDSISAAGTTLVDLQQYIPPPMHGLEPNDEAVEAWEPIGPNMSMTPAADWDMYHWLQDLTNIKNAFGSQPQDFDTNIDKDILAWTDHRSVPSASMVAEAHNGTPPHFHVDHA